MTTKNNPSLVFRIKAFDTSEDEPRTFTCYGSVYDVIDYAGDRAIKGCFDKSLRKFKSTNTMPKFPFAHDIAGVAVGKWLEIESDDVGLKLKGQFANTARGLELYELYKTKCMDSFSIGYFPIVYKYNHSLDCNDLLELDLFEISPVLLACNDSAKIIGVKMLTKSRLKDVLTKSGMDELEIKSVLDHYSPDMDKNSDTKPAELSDSDLNEILEDLPLFK